VVARRRTSISTSSAALTALVGDAGKRLHTGRSRNDQVATDIRLWLRDAIDRILALIRACQPCAARSGRAARRTVMPGFTHLQVAQPVTFGHHLLAYRRCWRATPSAGDCRRRVNRLPLGRAALAGTSYPIDREFVARELGFEASARTRWTRCPTAISRSNSAPRALMMTHLSRLSEELILWMSPRFGFIDLADRFCTGSSIMPQKKNPDVPELVRGKTGRVNGHLVALLTLMKGQPLAYNKDNQEDKEPLFDTVDTLIDTLAIYADMITGMTGQARRDARRGDAGLRHRHRSGRLPGEEGLPFRDAHEAWRARCGGRHRGLRPGRSAAGRTAGVQPHWSPRMSTRC
jgi:argininosuccinate lyase